MGAPEHQYLAAIRKAVKPDKQVWIDQWAKENRILPDDSPEPGKWSNDRAPYLIDIMRTMSPCSPYREGWVMKGVQVGGSSAAENFLGGAICSAAGNILVVFPTLDDAKQWELNRFTPMRDSTKALRTRIRDAREKGSNNTKLRKRYPGGTMRLVGANRMGGAKSTTYRYIKFEEPDDYPRALSGQGNLIQNFRNRAGNFGRKAKIWGDGTPTIDEQSAIQDGYNSGDKREWRMFCPGGCGEAQPLNWAGFVLPEKGEDPSLVAYRCRSCKQSFSEAQWKTGNYAPRPEGCSEDQARDLGLAHWVKTATGKPAVASWHLPSFVAPLGWRPWSGLVTDWWEAQQSEELLKSFVNNQMAECWKENVRTMVGADTLEARAENYQLMSVPMGGLIAVAGVDTQDNRLAIVVRVFGRNEESWGVWHSEIYGDPSLPEVWAKLAELLKSPIKHPSGQRIYIDAAAIDAGGHHQEDVFAFCRDAQLKGRHWFAIRGAKSYDAPKLGRPKTMEFTWRGKPVPGGAVLRWVGTQAIKNLIDGRLKLDAPGGGFYHFPLGFGKDYYKQMRAEKRVPKRNAQGHRTYWWEAGSGPHEAWDCEVYAYAAFLYVMGGRHQESVYRAREKVFAKVVQRDLLEEAADPPEVETVTVAGVVVNAATGEILTPSPSPPSDAPEVVRTSGLEESSRPAAAVAPAKSSAPKKQPKPKPPRRGFVRGW